MGKLSGPARLLAMSWPQLIFDATDGTKKLLSKTGGESAGAEIPAECGGDLPAVLLVPPWTAGVHG